MIITFVNHVVLPFDLSLACLCLSSINTKYDDYWFPFAKHAGNTHFSRRWLTRSFTHLDYKTPVAGWLVLEQPPPPRVVSACASKRGKRLE